VQRIQDNQNALIQSEKEKKTSNNTKTKTKQNQSSHDFRTLFSPVFPRLARVACFESEN